MTSEKQKKAARKNIKKAREKWKSMSSQARSRRQPEGSERARPGAKGEGNFYRIVVRDKSQFKTFRNHDIGKEGHVQRLSGKRQSGSWDTQAWLIEKGDAHKKGKILIGDSKDAKDVLDKLGSEPRHVKGDIFEARPRPNVPEKDKPTQAQKKARQKNIKKAQKARHR